jgi:hypothetical protein
MSSKNFLLAALITIAFPAFAQQPDMSLIPYRQGDQWGYASPDKKIVIAPTHDEANLFYEGYASVKKGDRYGYINKAGKLVIPYQYFSAKHFRFGYFDNPSKHKSDTVLFAGASLKTDGYEICINTKGIRMPKCPAINENAVADNDNTGMVTQKVYSNVKANGDLYDKILDDYKLGTDGDDNYYIAVKNNLLGVFNNKFAIVVPFSNSLVKKLVIGSTVYLLVERNGMQGVLNADGSTYIPVENGVVQYIKAANGKEYFVVIKDNTGTLKDIKLNTVFTGNYTNMVYDKEGDGLVLSSADAHRGFYFLNTNVLVAPKYVDAVVVKGTNYLLVTSDTGKKGYINNKGDEFFVE